MASWKRYFTPVATPTSKSSGKDSGLGGAFSNYSSNLKEYVTGPSNRIERYNQIDHLDLDPVINRALNVLAEFCTQENVHTKAPFYIRFHDGADDNEIMVLKETLSKWMYINDFRNRMYHIFRNVLKYGDVFFVRDPETYELIYVDPRNVEKVLVDDANGKTILSYFIRNVSYNILQKVATNITASVATGSFSSGTMIGRATASSPTQGQSSVTPAVEISSEHVVHLSLNNLGLDFINWPFSASILDSVYKPAKQKELLENAYLIHMVQRAPERRAFYVYVGDTPSHMIPRHLERQKNEIHQRRIPSRNGGQSIMDATYDPLSFTEDYFFPVNAEGNGPRLEMIPGSDTLSSGTDGLAFFNNELIRGLGIPLSYISTGGEDRQPSYNDGRTGASYIEEWNFVQTCLRYQRLFRDTFDFEFKLFCKFVGITISAADFDLEFEEPQSFSEFKQISKDSDVLNNLSSALGIPFLSKRFAMKRFGMFTEEELAENEMMWKEENKAKVKGKLADMEIKDIADVTLNNVGIKKTSDEEIDELEEEPDNENSEDTQDFDIDAANRDAENETV